jgi:CRP/FNR family transcriptional regulator, cyclic AMP receptor protein
MEGPGVYRPTFSTSITVGAPCSVAWSLTLFTVVTPVDLLARVDLFAEFHPDELSRLAGVSIREELRRGDIIFREGDAPDRLYVVLEGRIAISKRSADGREAVVALMEPGDLFGDMGLFQPQGRSAEARALEPSAVLAVTFDPVREIYENRPELLWGVVALLADRVRTMDDVLADSVFLDVTGRTAKRLLEMASERDEFVLPITQEELAAMVGASRERVNKAIASFVRLGWIEQADRRYRITDRDQLERRAR